MDDTTFNVIIWLRDGQKINHLGQEATFEKRDNAHPPGWLVGLEVQQKRSQKIGAFFADIYIILC